MKSVSEAIDLLERELPLYHHAEAMAHIDAKHANLWSHAMNELREHIAANSGSLMAVTYFTMCLAFVREYKADWITAHPGQTAPWVAAQDAYASVAQLQGD